MIFNDSDTGEKIAELTARRSANLYSVIDDLSDYMDLDPKRYKLKLSQDKKPLHRGLYVFSLSSSPISVVKSRRKSDDAGRFSRSWTPFRKKYDGRGDETDDERTKRIRENRALRAKERKARREPGKDTKSHSFMSVWNISSQHVPAHNTPTQPRPADA